MLDCMRGLLTTVSLLALGLWLGALVLFVQVAAVAFGALPPLFLNPADGIHGAGLVVGGTLRHLHYMGLICGLVFLLCSALLRAHVRWHSVVPQAVLVLVMVLLTAYSQSSPARATFDELHRQSTHVEEAILILGFVAFFVAGRRHSVIV
jgi:hypothetical protein